MHQVPVLPMHPTTATVEFGLHLDSTEIFFSEKTFGKCLKNCGGQGRT